ncbi:MAG: O-antigen ligase family protein [Gemmatimonadota bacterium]
MSTVIRQRSNLLTLGILLAMVPAGLVLVKVPFLSAGVLFGALLLAAVLTHPLVVVGVMLFIGPIDLSFLTGGFKGLFEAAGGLDMNGIRLLGMSGGLAITAVLLPNARRVLFGRWGIAYLIFLVWAGLTLIISPNLVDGLRLLTKLAYPLLIFVIVAGVATERRHVDRLLDYTLAGAALVVVLSLFYTMAGRYGVYDTGLIRVRGVTLHENPFSFYLLIALYMSFARFAVRAQWRYLVLAGLLGIWMVLTLTRITFLAGAVGMAGIAIYSAVAARNTRALFGAAAIALLVAVPLAPIVLQRSLGYVPSPAELIDLARSPMGLYEAINWQGREVVWPVVFAAFTAAPWTGLGLGASTAVMREYFPPQVGEVVHNEYLRLATDTGLVGVSLYAIAILLWCVAVIRADRVSCGAAREFTLPALAGIVSWSILALTDNLFDYYAPYTQFIGLLVGASVVAAAAAVRDADAQSAARVGNASGDAGGGGIGARRMVAHE